MGERTQVDWNGHGVYKERWEQGMVLENDKAELVWDFQFHLRKPETAGRPDLLLETKYKKQLLICDMACPMQQNIDTKRRAEFTRYQKLALEMRERRLGCTVVIVPVIIGAFVVACRKN